MNAPTHVMGGIFTASLLATHAIETGSPFEAAGIFGVAILGSLTPDIDLEYSRLGRYNPLAKYIKHRGFCHSLAFILMTSVLAVTLLHVPKELIIVFEAGVLSHILLDMLNKYGVQLFYPSRKYIALPIHGFRNGGKAETFIFWTLAILTCVQLYFKVIPGDTLSIISNMFH